MNEQPDGPGSQIEFSEAEMSLLEKMRNDPELFRRMYLTAYLNEVSSEIESRAEDIRKTSKGSQITARDLAQAAIEYAPGRRGPEKRPWNERIWTSLEKVFTSIIFVSAVLAIVFGLLGLFYKGGDANVTQGFLDIAKVFAGAVVGSAGATAVTSDSGA